MSIKLPPAGFFFAVFLCVILSACSQKQEKLLIGGWEATPELGMPAKLIFNKDHTAQIIINNKLIDGTAVGGTPDWKLQWKLVGYHNPLRLEFVLVNPAGEAVAVYGRASVRVIDDQKLQIIMGAWPLTTFAKRKDMVVGSAHADGLRFKDGKWGVGLRVDAPNGQHFSTAFGLPPNWQSPSKVPCYLECFPDKVVIYPGKTTVTWEDFQRPENAVVKLYRQVQAHDRDQCLVILAHPESAKFFQEIRKTARQRPIDVGDDALEAGTTCRYDEQEHQIIIEGQSTTTAPAISMKHLADQRPVFFECRNDQVFWIGKDALDTQVAKVFSSIQGGIRPDNPNYNQAMKDTEIGNEYYKVLPAYLLTMVLAVEPKPNVKGDNNETVDNPDSKFQQVLQKLDFKNQYAVFLVRDDGINIFHRSRHVAEALGFITGWELLGKNALIKFGPGGQIVDAQ